MRIAMIDKKGSKWRQKIKNWCKIKQNANDKILMNFLKVKIANDPSFGNEVLYVPSHAGRN